MKWLILTLLVLVLPFVLADRLVYMNDNTEIYQNTNINFTFRSYTYLRNFNRNGVWEWINESLFPCPNGNGWCSRNYYYNVSMNNTITFKSGNFTTEMSFDTLAGYYYNMNSYTVNGSEISYDLIPGYVTMKYQYLPEKLKEVIIIHQPVTFNNILLRWKFHRYSQLQEYSLPYICDNTMNCTNLDYSKNRSFYTLSVPFSRYKIDQYPLMIDPDQLPDRDQFKLTGSNISWNGYISYQYNPLPTNYSRFNNPSVELRWGCEVVGITAKRHRFSIEYDLTNFPEDANITSDYEYLRLIKNGSKKSVGAYNQSLFRSDYADDSASHYADMGTGFWLNSTKQINALGTYRFNLYFNNRTTMAHKRNYNMTAVGHKALSETCGAGNTYGRFAPKDYLVQAHRPYREINYTLTSACLPLPDENFVINFTCEYNDTTINFYHNTTIQDAGQIICRNCTLNYTKVPFHIDIWKGGILDLLNQSVFEVI